MKIFPVILIVFLVLIVKFSVIATNNHQQLHSKDRNHVEGLKKSFYDVLKVFFVDRKVRFDVIILGNVSQRLIDVVNYIGDALLDKLSFPVHIKRVTNFSYFDREGYGSYHIKQSALLLLNQETFESFNNFTYLQTDYPKEAKLFVYGHDLKQTKNELHTPFYYFLHDWNNSLSFYTYEKFSSQVCNKAYKKEINRFDFATLKWEKELEYYRMWQNHYQCPVKFYTDKSEDLSHLIDTAAKMRNFSIFSYPRKFDPNFPSSFYPHLTSIDIGSNSIVESTNYHSTTTFAEEEYNFAITPGMQYTSYEKMLLPFDEETWWYLIATFGGTFLAIFIVNLLPVSIRNILYGVGVKMPAFNVIGTFFGIGQLKLPENNFARIILMTFIIFCLIIRTAYQGVQFDMMTKEMRRPQPQTIDELFEKNYTIGLIDSDDYITRPRALFLDVYGRKRKNYRFYYTWELYCDYIFDEQQREVFLFDETHNLMYTKYCYRKFEYLDQIFMKVPIAYQLQYNHYMFDTIQNITRNLIPAGIPQRRRQNYYEERYKGFEFPSDEGPQVLTVPGLSFGFVIWLVACGFSAIVFFCEIISWLIWKRKRNMNQENENQNENIILNQVNIENVERQMAVVLIDQNKQEQNQDGNQQDQEHQGNQYKQEPNTEVIEIDQNLQQGNQEQLKHVNVENQDEELTEVVVDTQSRAESYSKSKREDWNAILVEINEQLDQEKKSHEEEIKVNERKS